MTWQQCIMFMTNKFGENMRIMIFWWFLGVSGPIFRYFYPVIYVFLFKLTFCIPNINNNMTWQQLIVFMTNKFGKNLMKLIFLAIFWHFRVYFFIFWPPNILFFLFKVTFCIPTINNNMTWQQCVMFMTNKFGANFRIMIFWWFLGIFGSIFFIFWLPNILFFVQSEFLYTYHQ